MSENGFKCPTVLTKHSLLFSILVIEILVIVPCVVFTILNIATYTNDTYTSYRPEFSQILSYSFLTPVLVLEVVWLLANFFTIYALHIQNPYILLLDIVVSTTVSVICVVLLVKSVGYIANPELKVEWGLLSFSMALVFFTLLLFVSIFVKLNKFQKIVKSKKAVQVTVEKNPEEPEGLPIEIPNQRVKNPDEISISFSRRSTLSIDDERFQIPPRI